MSRPSCKRLHLRHLGALLALVTAAAAVQTGRAQTTVLLGTQHPTVTDTGFFRGAAGEEINFGVRLVPVSDARVNVMVGGAGYYEIEATTYPPVNRLDTAGDRRTQLAYAQAYWDIARYTAAKTQARLRREVGFPSLFRPREIAGRGLREQTIWQAAQAEWDAAVAALDREASASDPLLRSQAFAAEYAAAVDTIRMPRLEASPHGMWVFMGFGPGLALGTAAGDFGGGAMLKLGLGYSYQRLRAGFVMHEHTMPIRITPDAFSQNLESSASWEHLSLALGYDLWRGTRFSSTAYGYVGGSVHSTGNVADDNEVELARGFAPGMGIDLRARLGSRRGPAETDYAGRHTRHPFTLWGSLVALRQPLPEARRAIGLGLTVGVFMDIGGCKYVEQDGARQF